MSRITRCRNCLGQVLSHLADCPHCERPIRSRSRRIFTRGAVIFMLVTLVAWTGVDTAIILHDRQQAEKRRAEDDSIVARLKLALCVDDPSTLPSILASSVAEEREQHPGYLPAEFVEDVVLRRVPHTHVHVSGRRAGVRKTSARTYEFAALVHRGGCWIDVRGRLGAEDGKLCCLELESVRSLGDSRPRWDGSEPAYERVDSRNR